MVQELSKIVDKLLIEKSKEGRKDGGLLKITW